MRRLTKLLSITLMLLFLRTIYTLAFGVRVLLNFNSFYSSENLDLIVIKLLTKILPLTHSFLILFLASSFFLVVAIYYFGEVVNGSETGFYTAFIYITSISLYAFLSETPIAYSSISLVSFIAMLFFLIQTETSRDEDPLTLCVFIFSWILVTFSANLLTLVLSFSFLSLKLIKGFYNRVSSPKMSLVFIAIFLVTAYLLFEKSSSSLCVTLFVTLFFTAIYSLLNTKIMLKAVHFLPMIQEKVKTLGKPSFLLLIFVFATSLCFFLNAFVNRIILYVVVSLAINFYFFIIGVFFCKHKDKIKLIGFFALLSLTLYFVNFKFNLIISFKDFANYLALILSPISGLGVREIMENSDLADRYILVYIVSYFSILLLAIPLFVF